MVKLQCSTASAITSGRVSVIRDAAALQLMRCGAGSFWISANSTDKWTLEIHRLPVKPRTPDSLLCDLCKDH